MTIKELENLEELKENINQTQFNYKLENQKKERLQKELQDIEISLIQIEESIKEHENAKRLLESLKNYKLREKKNFILDIINTALNDIFQDNLFIDIIPKEAKTTSKVTQKYDIVFYQNGIEIARNDEILKSNGGGVLQIISILFKILIGFIYSENTFYMLDESFSQVSVVYRERLSEFLRKFCEKYDFHLLVVSHSDELDKEAHLIYTLDYTYDSDGIRTTFIKDIKENKNFEYPYYFVNIKNFQSLKEINNFKIQGLTILRGPNNIGKSALLRAIESILYNNYKSNYLRFNSRKSMVEFGYCSDIDNCKSIVLEYSSSKVSFMIDGEKYYGKNLASDKLQEAVEQLGFKYINTKEFYKNFKGNLKEQTERIASTNQYDNLFLIGNKANETEKVFNFLFNTEQISLGIVKIKEKIQDLDKTFKSLLEQEEKNKLELIKINKLIQLYGKQFYYFSIKYFKKLNKNYQREKTILEISLKEISLLEQIIFKIKLHQAIKPNLDYINQMTESLKNDLSQIEISKMEISKIEQKKEKLERLETLVQQYHNLKSLLEIKEDYEISISEMISKIDVLKKRKEIIPKIIEKLQKIFQLQEVKNNIKNIDILNKDIQESLKRKEDYKNILNNLNKKYGITPCPTCGGLGCNIKD